VRNVDPKIVRALKARAGRKGTSAEAEHRAILAAALGAHAKPSFEEFLLQFPTIEGHDDLFDRHADPADDRPAPLTRKSRRRVPR
jgi:plasmid stability protein